MKSERYKRNQVEWALWQLFCGYAKLEVHSAFRTRIKRLLEIDRQTQDPNAPGSAFSANEDTPGRGSDAAFSAFDTVCLSIGLDMLDIGFKQSEVVFCLRNIRQNLLTQYKKIITFPLRSEISRGTRNEEEMVFMIIRKVEIKEPFPLLMQPPTKSPVIIEPCFCHGSKELSENLVHLTDLYRKAMVFELTKPIALLTHLLEEAPAIRRGRG